MTARTEESKKITTKAKKQLALRRSAVVAATSVENIAATSRNTIDFVTISRQITDFNRIAIGAELEFLDLIRQMNEVEVMITLYNMFDREGNGSITVQQVATCLTKMEKNFAYVDSCEKTISFLNEFDSDTKLSQSELYRVLKSMADSLGCNLNYVAELLAMKTALSDGDTILEESVENTMLEECMSKSQSSLDFFKDAVLEARIILLFQLFETDSDGTADFRDVAHLLFPFVKTVDPKDETPISNLLMVDSQSTRRISYDDFYVLILNLVAAAPDRVDFHEMANACTMQAVKPAQSCDVDLNEVFMGDELKKLAVEMGYSPEDHEEVTGLIEYGRMTRLFHLWDLDHSGKIDISEMMLGMRKFHEAKNITATMGECIEIINKFDTNNDEELDKKEFASLLVHFAKTVSVPLHELIDFMLVQSALRDNEEAETQYVKSIQEMAKGQMRAMKENAESSVTGRALSDCIKEPPSGVSPRRRMTMLA